MVADKVDNEVRSGYKNSRSGRSIEKLAKSKKLQKSKGSKSLDKQKNLAPKP